MNVLVLNGLRKPDESSKLIVTELVNSLNRIAKPRLINLNEKDIASCQGCFGCWIRTPGICIINDDGRMVAKEFMNNDCVILLSPVTFGGFSSSLKKAVDRLIPNILPHFTRIEGEIHHKPRYEEYPALLTIGLLAEKNPKAEGIFTGMISRMAINMYSPLHNSYYLYRNSPEKDLLKDINNISQKAGVING